MHLRRVILCAWLMLAAWCMGMACAPRAEAFAPSRYWYDNWQFPCVWEQAGVAFYADFASAVRTDEDWQSLYIDAVDAVTDEFLHQSLLKIASDGKRVYFVDFHGSIQSVPIESDDLVVRVYHILND